MIRLLATLNETPVPASKDGFAERLGRWFEWRDAIVLSGVLQASRARGSFDATVGATDAATRDARRVRAALDALVDPIAAPVAPSRRGRPSSTTSAATPSTSDAPADFATFRKRHVAAQRDMAMQIASLRERLRATLSTRSADMAKLAALDAVMERVVGEREHVLLATLPRWLEPHFKRLCTHDGDAAAAATPVQDEVPDVGSIERERGVREFSRDFIAVLRAELDLRWQPIDGLLQALNRPPVST